MIDSMRSLDVADRGVGARDAGRLRRHGRTVLPRLPHWMSLRGFVHSMRRYLPGGGWMRLLRTAGAVAALTLVACGDGESVGEDDRWCADTSGTYNLTITPLAQNECGIEPTGALTGTPVKPGSRCTTKTRLSENHCELEFDDLCPGADGSQERWTGKASISEDGAVINGTGTLTRLTNGVATCTSKLKVEYVKL